MSLLDEDIFIGMYTRQCLQRLFREGDLSSTEKTIIFIAVWAFYVPAMEYALANLPFNNDVLKNATFAHIPSREDASFVQVKFFVSRYITKFTHGGKICTSTLHIRIYIYRFNHLLPYSTPQESEQFSEEFSVYQLIEDNEIPQNIWDTATVKEDDENRYYRMGILWQFLSTLKMPDSSLCFERLAKVAKLILVIPHSNAEG